MPDAVTISKLDHPAPVLPAGGQPEGVLGAHDATPAPIVWYRRPAVQRRTRLAVRLLGMTPAEILHRAHRVVEKHRARRQALVRPPTAPGDAEARALLPPAMAEDPAAYLAARTTTRGFFDHEALHRLAAAAPERVQHDVRRTLHEARAIITQGIDLLGERFRPADPGFDWLAAPREGRLWPLAILDDSDVVRGVAADVRPLWEVNRHQFLVTLVRATVYSGESRYARACVLAVRRWIAANPPGLGVNWASSLEVGSRAVSWLWALQFLLGSPVLGAEDLRLWLASLRQHRDHLANRLSVYTDPTNHLIGETGALALLTIWLPEWPRSDELRTTALTILDRELARQVADDGTDREQATSYQRFVLDFVLQVIALADRNAIALPPTLRLRATAMLDAVAALVAPGQRAPRIGDSDDARGLPFVTEDVWDFGEILAVGSAVLGRRVARQAVAREYESAFWLGGTATTTDLDARTPPPVSEILPAGGYAILHASGADGDRLLFDCGPLGYPPHASHGHADLLSVLVDLGGEELLIDPGTFAYHDSAGRRDLLRATRSHNTVEIGGRDQADAFDPFKWLNLPRHAVERVHLGSDFDYVEAWHDGYRRLRPAVRHRRAVLGLRGGWLLIDWFEGRGQHRVARWFHAVPGTRHEPCGRSAIRLWVPSGRSALVLHDVGPEGDEATMLEHGAFPYSERYGHLVQAPVVRLLDDAELPAMRLTLLARAHAAGALRIERVEGSRATAVWFRLIDATGSPIVIAVRNPDAPVRVGPIRTDARVAIARDRGSGTSTAFFVSGGGGAEWQESR